MGKQKTAAPKYAAFALTIACIAIFTPNYAQYQASPLGPVLMEQFGLNNSQLASLFTAPMIPAIFLSLVGGLLIDKLGPKQTVGMGLIISAAGCVLRVFAENYGALMIATALTGVSACFIMAGAGKILGGFYGAEGVGSKMGILMACSTIGMTLAMMTSARFPSIRSAFIISAILACAAAVLWVLFMKNPPQTSVPNSTESGMPSIGECLKTALRSKGVWLVSFALFFIMSANVVISSFTPTVLAGKGIGPVSAGNLASCLTLGNLLGCFVAPFCVSKVNSQKKVLIVFGILAGVGVTTSWMASSAILLAVAYLLTGTLLGGMIPLLMSIPVQLADVGPLYAGTAGGIVGTIQVVGAVLVPSYIIAPIAGDSFTLLFILGGVCMVIAAALVACIREI